jgi:hypothetical protein
MTETQREQAADLKAKIDSAGKLFNRQKFTESGAEIEKALEALQPLIESGDADVLREIQPNYRRLKKAHELLTAKDVTLPSLPEWPQLATKSDSSTAKRNSPAQVSSSKTVSFTKQVAPILVRHCGRCHVRASRGGYSMATFNALLEGGENGSAITANEPDSSSFIELVESGKMPPRRKLAAQDIKTLKDWVAQGAKFDGDDQDAEIASLFGARNADSRSEGRP